MATSAIFPLFREFWVTLLNILRRCSIIKYILSDENLFILWEIYCLEITEIHSASTKSVAASRKSTWATEILVFTTMCRHPWPQPFSFKGRQLILVCHFLASFYQCAHSEFSIEIPVFCLMLFHPLIQEYFDIEHTHTFL